MGDLSVIVRLNGMVVESRVLSTHRDVWLGDAAAADVSFPGAHFVVRRVPGGLQVRGQTLAAGERLEMQLGTLSVELEHTDPDCARLQRTVPHELSGSFDGRFLLMLVCVVVCTSWIDAFEFWVSDHFAPLYERIAHHAPTGFTGGGASPSVESSKAVTVGRSDSRSGSIESTSMVADGPAHKPDDHSSQVRWYRWYRSEVPHDHEQLDAAATALSQDPKNAEARAVLGRVAYDADRYANAAAQYTHILKHHPEDPSARLRLAQSEMRRGHHTAEIRQYAEILQHSPHDVAALAGLVVALTRLERLDEAAAHLDELRLEYPEHALTKLTRAKVAALAGRDQEVLDHLDDLMRVRKTLNAQWRLELRRDIALDPAFARLRKDVRLRGVMNRHLGAAGPRPVR